MFENLVSNISTLNNKYLLKYIRTNKILYRVSSWDQIDSTGTEGRELALHATNPGFYSTEVLTMIPLYAHLRYSENINSYFSN